MSNDGLEFMGTSIGILALICTLVLLFGRSGTRKLIGWTIGLLILGWVTIAVWAWANAPKPITDANYPRAAPRACEGIGCATPAPIIAPPPQPAPNNTLTVERYPGGWEFDPVTKQWHRNR
jgi:hypothetical protein